MEQCFKQLKEDVFPMLRPLMEGCDEFVVGSKLVEDGMKTAEREDSEKSVASLGNGQLLKGLGLLHSHLLVLSHISKLGQQTISHSQVCYCSAFGLWGYKNFIYEVAGA